MNKANIYMKSGKHEDAISCFDGALKAYPGFIPALFLRGKMFYELKNYKDSLKSFGDVLSKDSSHQQAWHFRGASLEQLGDYPEALKSFNRALEIDPNSIPTLYLKPELS